MSKSSKGQGKVPAATAGGSRRFRAWIGHLGQRLAQAERPLPSDLPPATLDEAWSDNFVAKFSPPPLQAANFEVKFSAFENFGLKFKGLGGARAGLGPGAKTSGVPNPGGDISRLAFTTQGGGD